MKKCFNNRYKADDGKFFACTEYGYKMLSAKFNHQLIIGSSIPGFYNVAPCSWVNNGYVEEIKVGL